MRKKLLTVLGILILTPIILIVLIYLGLTWYYADTYINGVTVNDVYAAGMTPEELNDILLARTESASFTISDRNGTSYEIPIEEMHFAYTYLDELKSIKAGQNPFAWGLALISGEQVNHRITPKGQIDTNALQEYLMSMPLIKDQADPDNIRVEIVLEKDGYHLIDDTTDLLDTGLVIASVEKAVLNGERYIDLKESGCYVEMEYTPEMKKTLAMWEKVDDIQDVEIVCQFYDGDEVIDAGVISGFLAMDEETGTFMLDEEGKLVLDEEAVTEYVEGLAKLHDNASGPWRFTPTRGGVITIEKGNYGYKLNQKKEIETLTELIYEGKDAKTEAIYSQRGFGSTVGNDIGDTYIEVDMGNQMMYYYVDGHLQLSTPVVTGNTSKGNGTPERVCYIYYKQRNRVLIGEDYRTPVSYWMAVYGNIGIHDATWRGSFGGKIYRTNGSHGCINTPMKAVSQLYEMAVEGTPVVMFY